MFLFWNRPTHSARQSALHTRERLDQEFIEKLDQLHDGAIRTGLVTKADLQEAYRKSRDMQYNSSLSMWYTFGIMAFVVLLTPIFYETLTFLLGVKCFLPNNHLVWEATRPISDCGFCRNVDGPLILKNMSREELAPYAYSTLPIVIKNAVSHWPATSLLSLEMLKEIYGRYPEALDEDCHFLNFHSDLKSIRDVFNMSPERANLSVGSTWYVGFSNCHLGVLEELRKLYGRPHFLPVDAELSNIDYVFLGYEQGAYMHLDYIHRLMWQAQLKGNKSWILAPTPECDHVCQSFSFYVEPGDAVLVDTRIWYHGTSIPKGQFALTIQSEYS
uniref:Cupin-like domain-containing protein n=1 Tax=Glossina pallidipes TaxID=7398 RepID=A0A1A9ZB33_GLOPL